MYCIKIFRLVHGPFHMNHTIAYAMHKNRKKRFHHFLTQLTITTFEPNLQPAKHSNIVNKCNFVERSYFRT